MNLDITNIQVSINKRTSRIENTIFLYILNDVLTNSSDLITFSTVNFKKITTEDIYKALFGLMEKLISFSYITSENNLISTYFPHVISFSEENDTFKVNISKHIVNIFKNNTLENYISLKTFFYFRKKSMHIFFNLILQNNFNTLTMTLDELKNIFNIDPNSYDRFFDFEKAILKPLIEVINKHSNYTLSYTKIKKGNNINNKIVSLEFTLKNNLIVEQNNEVNYLIQLLKHNINDYKSIWNQINLSVNEIGFLQCKRAILFLKENNLVLTDKELINYLKRKGENIEEILQLNQFTLIKEKMSLFKDSSSFTKLIYDTMISYNFYYSLNFIFLKDIKNFEEGNTFFYRDDTYIIFGTYIENKGTFKIFQIQK